MLRLDAALHSFVQKMMIAKKAAVDQPTLTPTVLGFRGSIFQFKGGLRRAAALQDATSPRADAHRLAAFISDNDAAHSSA